jgi:hypothetical protein
VRDDVVVVEDLQSRNGVFVNDERVESPLLLTHGDVIRVGAAKMTVVRRGSRGRAETLVQKPVTSSGLAFGVLGTLADKAITLGHGDEAERILARQLDQYLAKAESSGPLASSDFERCAHYGHRIGTLTKRGKWLDYIFRLHTAQACLMDSDLVNSLYSVAAKMSGANPHHLRTYLAAMKKGSANFAPGERLVVKRLEGLEVLLS